jgi:quercetin dioxygenase-like cupin family protein
MIIRAADIEVAGGRKPYPLGDLRVEVGHFVVRITTPEVPFGPHKHERPELWFIVQGEADVTLDGQVHAAAAGDLILIEPWVEHGLRVADRAEWLCLG